MRESESDCHSSFCTVCMILTFTLQGHSLAAYTPLLYMHIISFLIHQSMIFSTYLYYVIHHVVDFFFQTLSTFSFMWNFHGYLVNSDLSALLSVNGYCFEMNK